jgi:hypothetical protein
MTLKSLLCACLLALCMCAAAQTTISIAPDAASKEDIKKLFEVMHIRQQMEQVMKQVMKQMQAITHEQIRKRDPNVTNEEIARLDAMSEQLVKDMPVEGILDDMVPVYQKHLTKNDVDAMVTFYSSPTGQKILGEMPAMTAEGMQAMQPRLRKMMDEATAKADKMMREQVEKPNSAPAPRNQQN